MLNEKAIVVVTGASRGIGREIAIQLAKKVADGSHFVLIARNEDKLNETRSAILRNGVSVLNVVADLAAVGAEYLTKITSAITKQLDAVQLVLVVHNAGSVGDVHLRTHEMNDAARWHAHLQSNLVAAILLNNAVYNAASHSLDADRVRFIAVDITSIAAIRASPSSSQYALAKAAREAYFRAFAVEHQIDAVRVLSYSPGPVDTDLFEGMINNSFFAQGRERLKSLREKNEALTPPQTVARLVGILDADKYASGARIDYLDAN